MKLKKKKGMIDEFGIPLITIVTIFIVIMAVISSNKDTNKINTVDSIARNYVLSMEAVGYLDSESEKALIKDLQNIGMKSINLSGTTKSKIGYGKKISLVINGEVEINKYVIKDIFSLETKKEKKRISRIRTTTAKY